MIRIVSLCFVFFALLNFAVAQNFKLEGEWQLNQVEIENLPNNENEITQENCFFSHYLDPLNLLEFKDHSVLITIGGESYLYDWQIENHQLIFSANNIAMIKKQNGDIETHLTQGETVLNIQRKGKVLILSNFDVNFKETYSFQLVK